MQHLSFAIIFFFLILFIYIPIHWVFQLPFFVYQRYEVWRWSLQQGRGWKGGWFSGPKILGLQRIQPVRKAAHQASGLSLCAVGYAGQLAHSTQVAQQDAPITQGQVPTACIHVVIDLRELSLRLRFPMELWLSLETFSLTWQLQSWKEKIFLLGKVAARDIFCS